MFHLCGFAEDLDPAAAFVGVSALVDQSLSVNGDNLQVPRDMANIVALSALISATVPVGARLESPSLRQIANINIEPVALGLVFADPQDIRVHPMNPTPLMGDEDLNLFVNTNPAAAEFHYGLVWLSDGPQTPVNGPMYSVRATAAIALNEAAWVFGNLTFDQTLPVGRYQIVGMRAHSANLIAARLVYQGSFWRPGVPAVANVANAANPHFRYGRFGSFGEFDSTLIPGVECLGVTDTAEVFIFDLIKVA